MCMLILSLINVTCQDPIIVPKLVDCIKTIIHLITVKAVVISYLYNPHIPGKLSGMWIISIVVKLSGSI